MIAFCLCSLGLVYAEEPQREGVLVRFGGQVGGGLVDWAGEDADEGLPGEKRVAKFGVSLGAMAVVNLSRLLSLGFQSFHLSLQPEFLYATKGANLELDGEHRASTNMTYLQAGLLLRTEYATAGRATPYFVLGPELGFLRSVEFKTRFGSQDTKDDYKSTDLGLILGLGAMYALPPYGSLGLELRGDLGLVSIDGQGDGDEIRNAALTLLLVYLY
jgi:opacity protein-like surface antigen